MREKVWRLILFYLKGALETRPISFLSEELLRTSYHIENDTTE